MAPISKEITLENGCKMPIVGFGTWQAPEDELEKAVDLALAAGYRHIDAAPVYLNEKAIGRSLNKFIGNNPEKRKELFICTKLPPSGHNVEHIHQLFEQSLIDLQLDYLDLYLVHTPFAFQYEPDDLHPTNPDGSIKLNKTNDIVAVWKELEKLKASGRVKNIGLSNFNISQVDRILSICTVRPACLQVECHLMFQQNELLKACKERNIPIVAYSPLGSKELAEKLTASTGKVYPNLFSQPCVLKAAAAHGKTPAQILLRHNIQKGIAVIPKSTNAKRIAENIDIFDFELTTSEMNELNSLDRGEEGRICDMKFFVGVLDHPEYPFHK